MLITPATEGVNVTLVGKFKPSIFTPGWFCVHGLLPEEALGEATLQIAHPQICEFNFKDLHLRVDEKRFQLGVAGYPFDRVCRIAVSVFKKHLPNTPLHLFGINRHVHLVVESLASRDEIIQSLAPISVWRKRTKNANIGNRSIKMTSIRMTQTEIKNRSPKDGVNVVVEPSNRVGEGKHGIYVEVNDHYESVDQGSEKMDVITELENRFDASLQQSKDLIDCIASLQDS